MYPTASVAGVTVTGTLAYTGFQSMRWVWAAMALVFLGLLLIRWGATFGVQRTNPGAAPDCAVSPAVDAKDIEAMEQRSRRSAR